MRLTTCQDVHSDQGNIWAIELGLPANVACLHLPRSGLAVEGGSRHLRGTRPDWQYVVLKGQQSTTQNDSIRQPRMPRVALPSVLMRERPRRTREDIQCGTADQGHSSEKNGGND